MAEPMKEMFNCASVRALGQRLAEAGPFDVDAFVEQVCEGLELLELKGRVVSIAAGLRACLPSAYLQALAQLLRSLPPPIEGTEAVTQQFVMWPLCTFVERYGLEHPEASLEALHALTQRFSAEFAIRPYLVAYPELTLATLQRWVSDADPHVRRLVSEGSRPLLPWGGHLEAFRADPSATLALITQLRDDAEPYVRRSVANHLNDISKDHPQRVVQLAQQWWAGASAERQALLRHALRGLIKAGDPGALAVLGYGGVQLEAVQLTVSPEAIALGGAVQLRFVARSTAAAPQQLLIDYAVHHVKANGSRSAKVFKGATRVVGPAELVELTRQHGVKPISTRRYYPGEHLVDILVNGQVVASGAFTLTV